jgi:hypothetical protein
MNIAWDRMIDSEKKVLECVVPLKNAIKNMLEHTAIYATRIGDHQTANDFVRLLKERN